MLVYTVKILTDLIFLSTQQSYNWDCKSPPKNTSVTWFSAASLSRDTSGLAMLPGIALHQC